MQNPWLWAYLGKGPSLPYHFSQLIGSWNKTASPFLQQRMRPDRTLLHAISLQDDRSFIQNTAKLAESLHGILQDILQCFAVFIYNIQGHIHIQMLMSILAWL